MKPLALLTLLAAMAVPAYADTTVIYADSYSSGSVADPTPILGAQPDVVDSTGASYGVGTGTASGTFTDNGSEASIFQGNETWFYLPFNASTLPSETTGYLTLTMEMASTGSAWAAFGFTSNDGTALYNQGNNWLLTTDSAIQAFKDANGGIGTQVVNTTTTTGDDYFQIQLNLATNNVTFSEGTSATSMSTILYSGTYSGSVANYTALEFEAQGTDGTQTWDNLNLTYSTTVVPEPSAAYLILGGLVCLIGFIRLRASRA